MYRSILLFALVCSAVPALSRDKPENWIEVRSEHFVVATDADEKQGRRIADQFERMRSTFHRALPKLEVDPGAPIVVLAVKNDKDFRALEPEAYLAKGQLKLGGLFLRAPDKNYVLMRLDAEGEHPYEVIYHEYTHLLLAKSSEWIPLWVNEGLAEFYQNTDIRDKDVLLGQASAENLALLRQQRLLPLAALFAVDMNSPYYHEENKGSIFYAESWVLTHYLITSDFKQKTHRLSEYLDLLSRKVDPAEAANRAFGNLQQLQHVLESYVQQAVYSAVRLPGATEVDESKMQVRPLTAAQTDAVRADFLAYNQRTTDARALLDAVLKEDPNNVLAHETMGYLEFRAGNTQEAKKWYAQAVQLDSQSYLAHYYFAAMSMTGAQSPGDDAQIENSLRASIKLNPLFAPSYDRLAVLLGMQDRDLEEAHRMGLQAVALDPENVGYRLNIAFVLMKMQQSENAVRVLKAAEKLTKNPQESAAIENALMNATLYQSSQEQRAEMLAQRNEAARADSTTITESTEDSAAPVLAHRQPFVAKGPHRFVTGVLKGVRCTPPQIDLTVAATAKTLALHSENYYKIEFSALNFAPQGELNPCKDLEGRPAKVEYVESADTSVPPQVLSIELHK